MRSINLHVVLIALVASIRAAASFIPIEERAIAAESEDSIGFFASVDVADL
jgi:hypothetical protein